MPTLDPLARVDALMRDPLSGLSRRRKKAKEKPQGVELTPEATESLVKSVGNTALGGLAKAGNLLDLPGSSIRDLLAGENPFDQWLSPTSGENRVGGRDLLERWGVLGKNKPGLDWGDAAGFGVDLIADPLTFLTGGASAVGKAGKVAKAAGLLDNAASVASKSAGKTVGPRVARMTVTPDALMREGGRDAVRSMRSAAKAQGFDTLKEFRKAHGAEPIGALAGLGRPFGAASVLLGKADSPTAMKIAGGLDKVGGAIKQTAPVRHLRGLFDGRVKGQADKFGQELAEGITRGERKAKATGKLAAMKASDDMERAYGVFDEAFGDVIRGENNAADIPGLAYKVGDVVHAADRGNYGYVRRVTPDEATVYFRNPETGSEATKAFKHSDGLLTPTQASVAQRRSLDAARATFDKISRVFAETGDLERGFAEFTPGLKPTPKVEAAIREVVGSMVEAKDALARSIEALGGDVQWMQGIDSLFHFPRYAHKKVLKKSEATRLASTVFAGMKQRNPELRNLPEFVVNKIANDRAARSQGAEYILSKYGDYLEDAFDNGFSYTDEAGNAITGKMAHARALEDFAKSHKVGDLFTRGMTEDFSDYMVGGQLAANTIKAVTDLFIRSTTRDGASGVGVDLATALQRMGMKPDESLKAIAERMGVSVDQARKYSIPAEVVRGAQGFVDFMNKPAWSNAIMDGFDEATRIIKESLTMPWPSFAGRNFGSGQFVNMTSGLLETPGDIKSYLTAIKDAWNLRKGGDAQFLRELQAYDVVSHHGFMDTELLRAPGQGILPANPLNARQSYQEAAQFVGDNASVLDRVPGVRSARRGYRTAIGSGAKLNQNVEWLNRAPMYLYLKRKGFSPKAAAEKVFELQFDYSALAPFERQVMRRAMPFYAFTRFAAPLVLKTLGRHPGGALSHTIQGSALASGGDATTPGHIADTASIALGEQPDGSQRYLTGFGLAHEGPLGLFNGPREAGLELLGMTHPLAKGPLEWATGQSFFQRGLDGGRPLDDLDPTIGRTISNVKDRFTGERTRDAAPFLGSAFEHAVANSPLSRVASTARTLSDPRKGLGTQAMQFLTGMRVADVSPAVQDATLAAKAEQLLKEFPQTRSYAKTYLPPDELAKMPEEERLRALQYKALLESLDKRRKDRAKRREVAAR